MNVITIKTKELLQEEKDNKELQEYIQFARNKSVSIKTVNVGSKSRIGTISLDKVKKAIQDPVKNVKILQVVSQALQSTQGVYERLLKYFSSALTYDYMIMPYKTDIDKETQLKKYIKSCEKLNKLKIKYIFPYIQFKRMLNGEIYLYKQEGTNSTLYYEMPNSICRLSSHEDFGIWRYEIDFSKITENTIESYPVGIQTMWGLWRNKKDTSSWVEVDENGFAFPTRFDSTKSYPPMLNLFPRLMEIEGIESLQTTTDENDTIKFIHCKVPINKDSGKPVLDKTLVDSYVDSLQKRLPEGYSVVANPFDVQGISTKGNATTEKRNLVEEAIKKIYAQAGVTEMLFSSEKGGSEALKKSIEVDMQSLFSHTLPLFNNYLTYEVFKFGYLSKMLPISYFNQQDVIKESRENLAYGGSRMYFIAACGFEPLEAYNTLTFEQDVLDIDNKLMIPKLTSHTMTGDEVGEQDSEAGRPKTENPSDITEQVKDNQE